MVVNLIGILLGMSDGDIREIVTFDSEWECNTFADDTRAKVAEGKGTMRTVAGR